MSIAVRMKGIKAAEGYWSYVLETVWKGETKTVEDVGMEMAATVNILNLMALYRGLERMHRPSKINIFTDSAYLAGAVNNNWLDIWAHNDWKNSKGQQIKNSEIWKEIWQQSMEHELTVEVVESHLYKSWQQGEMKKLAREAKNVDFPKCEGTFPQNR